MAVNDAVSDAVPLTIAEQTGDRRVLTLTARALPYRPIAFSGEQRSDLTAYPGNPVMTQQVLGAAEEPSEWSGYWKDRFIGDTSQASPSMAFYTKDGQLNTLLTVVVQWGPVSRRGIVKRLEQRWHNIHDVEWTLRFEWSSQNDPEVPAVIAKDVDYQGITGTLQAKFNQILTLATNLFDMVANAVQPIQNAVVQLGTFVQQTQDTVQQAVNTTMPIVDQQRRLAGILGDVGTNADSTSALVTSQPAEQIATTTSGAGSVEGARLAVESQLRQLISLLRDMKYAALEAQQAILKAINPDIVAMFTARAQTDLRQVAVQYYRRQDDWRSLMLFNGLTDSRLSAGQVIFVPKLGRPLDGSQ